jgi:hypothetical protein
VGEHAGLGTGGKSVVVPLGRGAMKRLLVVVAVVTALTLSGVGLLNAASAQSNTTKAPAYSSQTIRLLEKGSHGAFVDLAKPGVTIGDTFSFNSVLTNLNGERVGRLDAFSVVTGAHKRRAGSIKVVTLHLRRGDITTQTTESPHFQQPRPEAITGGTGAYVGVGGVLAFAHDGHELVLHLTR